MNDMSWPFALLLVFAVGGLVVAPVAAYLIAKLASYGYRAGIWAFKRDHPSPQKRLNQHQHFTEEE
jgi:hypothetical protein